MARSLELLEQRAKALERQLHDTRCEVQVLRNKVSDMQVRPALL